jgi:Flp pilus assembly protein TadG
MKTEKGQALILIAFGIVAILSLTALAIDGGNAFADRRHAQNAVDNAALSAALAILSSQDGQTAAEALITANGYDIASDRSASEYHRPPISGPYAGNNQYLQVILTSNIDTWFARIVGMEQVTNRVEAVARAKPSQAYFFGNAVVSLSPGGKPSQPEFRFTGGGTVNVTGSGVFVNSSDNCAIDRTNNTNLNFPGGITTGGGTACGFDSSFGVSTVPQIPYPPSFPEFEDLCTPGNGRNVVTVNSNQSFPVGTGHNIESDTVYCISGDFKVTNDNHGPYSAVNVTFVVLGSVEVTGGTLNLSSPPDKPLFYLPYAANRFNNTGNPTTDVKITGNSGSSLRGMVLAPASECNISGGSDTGIVGQVICYEVGMTGSSGTAVEYNDSDNPDEPPQIELTQ